MAVAEPAQLDPMHQFAVQPIAHLFDIGGRGVYLTNSAVWMGIAALLLWIFMLGGMKRRRPGSLRHAQEVAHMERWLATATGQIDRNYALAVEILRCRRAREEKRRCKKEPCRSPARHGGIPDHAAPSPA